MEIVEWVVVIGLALLVALALKTWVFQVFSIPSESMEHTLEIGDRVVVSKIDYRFGEPARSQLVVFDNLDPLPGDPPQIIKRIVAVAGDTVASEEGRLLVNGEAIEEPYLVAGTRTLQVDRQVVPDGHVFVMGDNRSNSKDSRIIGPVPVDAIVGRARLIVWPPGRISTL